MLWKSSLFCVRDHFVRPVKIDFMFNIQNLCQTDARAKKLHKRNKIAQSLFCYVCAIFSRAHVRLT